MLPLRTFQLLTLLTSLAIGVLSAPLIAQTKEDLPTSIPSLSGYDVETRQRIPMLGNLAEGAGHKKPTTLKADRGRIKNRDRRARSHGPRSDGGRVDRRGQAMGSRCAALTLLLCAFIEELSTGADVRVVVLAKIACQSGRPVRMSM